MVTASTGCDSVPRGGSEHLRNFVDSAYRLNWLAVTRSTIDTQIPCLRIAATFAMNVTVCNYDRVCPLTMGHVRIPIADVAFRAPV